LRASSLIAVLLLSGTLQASEKLVIISPHWEGVRHEYGRAFAEWYQAHYGRAVDLDWRDLGGTSDDLKFVIGEFASRPTGIGIDLFFGGGIDPFYEMAKRDLLEPFEPLPSVLEGIPSELGGLPLYDPRGRWFGTALSGFGILYNRRVLEYRGWPLLSTWRELAEQAPPGSVGSSDPRNSGSIHLIYEMILQRYGWEDGWKIIYQLGSKVHHFDRVSSRTVKDCTMGNTAYALAVDFYAMTQIAAAGRENMGLVFPKDCVVINPDCIGILRGAPHREVARRFVEFCLSEAGQSLLMLPRGHPGGARNFSIERMSMRPALYERYRGISLVTINPFAEAISFRYDPAKGAKRWEVVNDILGATVIDLHPELVAAGRRGNLEGCPPVGEEEALRLAVGGWREPSVRQRKLLEWQRWASERYAAKR